MKLYLVFTSLLVCFLAPTVSLSVDCPNKEPREIEAKNYWYYLHERKFQQTTEDETFIYGVASFHCDAKVKVNKADLNNRQDKEAAYLNILRNSVLPMYDPKDELPLDMSKAEELTGMEFETQLEWIEWWSRNNRRLKLSEDGSILVVKRCAKTEGLEKVIAKIGSRNITYDEIMDDGCEENYRNREITELNKIIRDEIIKQEITAMDYNPSDNEIEKKSKEIIQSNWETLAEDETERQKIFEMHRKYMLTQNKALSIWLQDKQKGEEFAQKELIPLVKSPVIWEQLKKWSDNEEVLKGLKTWEQFADVPASEYMDVYLKLYMDGSKKFAANEIKMEKFRMKVVPNYNELHEADRENEFRAWLRKRMAEETVIYDDNYKLALEIY